MLLRAIAVLDRKTRYSVGHALRECQQCDTIPQDSLLSCLNHNRVNLSAEGSQTTSGRRLKHEKTYCPRFLASVKGIET